MIDLLPEQRAGNEMAKTTLSKAPVGGRRPGDTFTRQGTRYRVVAIRLLAGSVPTFVTESTLGRQVWFAN